MKPETIRRVPLREALGALPICARWLNDEWGRGKGYSLAQTEERLRRIAMVKSNETTLIASMGRKPVGVCLLVECDVELRAGLTPWLSSLFVAPEHRHKAIGRKLVRGVETAAGKAGAESLFLYTPDRESFYAELGWETVERLQLEKGECAVMRKWL